MRLCPHESSYERTYQIHTKRVDLWFNSCHTKLVKPLSKEKDTLLTFALIISFFLFSFYLLLNGYESLIEY